LFIESQIFSGLHGIFDLFIIKLPPIIDNPQHVNRW